MNRRQFLRLAGSGCGAMLLPVHGENREDALVDLPPKSVLMDPGTLQSTYTQVNGVRVHALASVDPAPPGAGAIVLVHGSGLSHQYMIPTARLLTSDFRVYVPDIPGYGDSGDPGEVLNVPEMADWLAAWMPAIGLERASFLGNSFGCQVIADIAARYPERVERTVLQGPTTPPPERSTFWQFVRWRQNQRYNPKWLGEVTNVDYHKAGVWRLIRSFMFQITDRIEAKAPYIKAPTLVVRGEYDPIASQDFCELIVRLCPDARLQIIPDVAHTMVVTGPAQLAEATRAFLSEANR